MESKKGMLTIINALITSKVIIKCFVEARSITLPTHIPTSIQAKGLIIYSPATASAEPVISKTIKLIANK